MRLCFPLVLFRPSGAEKLILEPQLLCDRAIGTETGNLVDNTIRALSRDTVEQLVFIASTFVIRGAPFTDAQLLQIFNLFRLAFFTQLRCLLHHLFKLVHNITSAELNARVQSKAED
jgi:hypothetical protein